MTRTASAQGSAERVLVVNAGSSSVKYQLVEPGTGVALAGGIADRIGQAGGTITHRWTGEPGDGGNLTRERRFADHTDAVHAILDAFAAHGPALEGLAAAGHRIVHGGERFTAAVLAGDEVLAAIDELSPLAPLHNPAGIAGIRALAERLPGVPQVAVFDTAFHTTIPTAAATYAVPAEWRTRYGVRRYGFHGTSHAYVSRQVAQLLGRPVEEVNVIVLHLGNGASACAVQGGRSIDTSMGMTPLQGLVMGTRSGDLDPAVPGYLARVAGLDAAAVDEVLNTRSGLTALAGAGDLRDVIARVDAGDETAAIAIDVYCYRVRSYVGAYLAALGHVDAVVFTAGVGENVPLVRERSLSGLAGLGIVIDDDRNHDRPGAGGDLAGPPPARRISPDDAKVAVLVVPTNEEREIATQALAVVRGTASDRP
jgi:acetate kinase